MIGLFGSSILLKFYLGINLNNNSLGGKIPFEIGRLNLIHELDLKDDNFLSNIPSEISKLTNMKRLDLSMNRLSRKIPVSLSCLHLA